MTTEPKATGTSRKPALLVLRADADHKIGTGHVMRCLALAQEWQRQGGTAYFLGRINGPLRQRLEAEGCRVLSLPVSHPDPRDRQALLSCLEERPGRQGWVAVDGYHFDAAYHQAVRACGWPLLIVDDYAHLPAYHADILLNGNVYARDIHYRTDMESLALLGPRYALLRREFRRTRQHLFSGEEKTWPERQQGHLGRRLLVTMGGADPDNASGRVVEALLAMGRDDLEVKIVIGPFNPYRESLAEQLAPARFHAELLPPVENMADLMRWADLAISAGGSTCLELVALGVPMVLTILADNQERVVESLALSGAAVNLGWVRAWGANQAAGVIQELLADPEKRRRMAESGQCLVDGHGGERVVRSMRLFHFSLRQATADDCETIFQWANDPQTRAASFHGESIAWPEHCHWFSTVLADPDHIFFLAVGTDGSPLGQVRFAMKGGQEATISVGLGRDVRGAGIGSLLIRRACDQAMPARGLLRIRAMIKPENVPSLRAFAKAGFQDTGRTEISGQQAVIMEYNREE